MPNVNAQSFISAMVYLLCEWKPLKKKNVCEKVVCSTILGLPVYEDLTLSFEETVNKTVNTLHICTKFIHTICGLEACFYFWTSHFESFLS